MEELNGYTPPASLNLSDFQDAIGDAVVQAIIKIGIRVNREELLKALKYDRGQYKAGYEAGFADGFVETLHIVRCRDCKFWEPYGSKAARKIGDPLERYGGCEIWHGGHLESDFCSRGQRRDQSADVRNMEEGNEHE